MDAYFEQFSRNVNQVLADKDYKKAYKLCEEMALRFPGNSDVTAIKSRIVNEVRIENERVIESKLETFDELWDQKNYAEIIKQVQKLLKLDPTNKKLKKWNTKAQAAYKSQLDELQKDFYSKKEQDFETLLKNSPHLLVDALFNFDLSNPGNITVRKMTEKFRDKLIEKKIKEREDLIYSDKFEAIGNFIHELRNIDEKNPRIKDLEGMLKMWEHSDQQEQRSEFIYKGETHLETLMKLHKYDKAIKVAEEILEVDPSLTKVRKLLEKAQGKFFVQTREMTIGRIEADLPSAKVAYDQGRDDFVAI